MKHIVVAISLLLVAGCSHSAEVRPLALTVLDAETGKPIPNVPVYYELETAGLERYMLFFWKIDPVVYRPIIRRTYTTDNEGRVSINAESVSLRKYEQLFEEAIYINMDLKSNEYGKYDANIFFSSKYDDQLRNPLNNYIGAILRTATRVFGSDEIRGIRKNKGILFESIFIDNSLSKKSDAIVIHLKKASQ